MPLVVSEETVPIRWAGLHVPVDGTGLVERRTGGKTRLDPARGKYAGVRTRHEPVERDRSAESPGTEEGDQRADTNRGDARFRGGMCSGVGNAVDEHCGCHAEE